MPTYASFRICAPPPFTIHGGRTRWVILAEYFGKNGSSLEIVAQCVETRERIVFLSGRTRSVLNGCSAGFTVEVGTLGYRILRRASQAGYMAMTVLSCPDIGPHRGPPPYPLQVWRGHEKSPPSLEG